MEGETLVGWILATVAFAGLYGAVKNKPWLSVLTSVVNPLAKVKPSIYDNVQDATVVGAGYGGTGGQSSSGLPVSPQEFDARFRAMQLAAPNAIIVTSGLRTLQEQARLYAEKPGLAAPPGRSNHEIGLAKDIASTGNGMAWVHAHAAEFGMYFPMGNEPWHIEPIETRGWHR